MKVYDNYEDEKSGNDRELKYLKYDDWLKNCDKLKYRLNIKGEDYFFLLSLKKNITKVKK